MKILEKLNDPALGKLILDKIKDKAGRLAGGYGRPVNLMEVCGTHTTAISRYGLRSILSGLVDLRSGPGCPVCVTPAGALEQLLELSREENIVIATFGDMLRVPGVHTSLEKERARGAEVKIVYSPADAVTWAGENPGKEVVFAGVGFETTAPPAALSVLQAGALDIKNFSIYSAHKLIPPAIKTLLDSKEFYIDGFILPGHVSAVTGSVVYEFIGRDYGVPSVVAGFTPFDILDSIHLLLEKITTGDAGVVNNYRRVVRDWGNSRAQGVINECYYPGRAAWRGFGIIPESGLFLREEYRDFDAAKKFSLPDIEDALETLGCRCGEVLHGLIVPPECPLFGDRCSPAAPAGPCMVSSEGACAAYYKYEDTGGY